MSAWTPNRKRKLQMDDYTIDDKRPTKKRKVSNNHNNDNSNNNIIWKNKMIITKNCIDKLNQIISQTISIKEHGFGIINDDLYQSVINKNPIFIGLQTVNGLLLKNMPQIINLLKELRATKIMNKQLNCAQIIRLVLKSNDFGACFDIKNNNKLYEKCDIKKWLNICNLHGIPPYMLLTNWLKMNKVFKKNKQINQMVIKTQLQTNESFQYNSRCKVINNQSFRTFCVRISMKDSSCFQYETDRREKSQQFEQLMYNKLKELMFKNEMNVIMMTEKQQRAKQNKKNKKNENQLTPDILFSEPIMINNQEINWIDMKNFFMTKGFLWAKTNKTAIKYTRAFGNGAVICRGFQNSLKQSANCLLLEAFCDRE